MSYNLTNFTGSNNIYSFLTEINNLTNQYYAIGTLFSLFIIIFVMMSNREIHEILLVNGVITSLVSIMFFSIGWVSQNVIIIPILLTIVGIIATMMQK